MRHARGEVVKRERRQAVVGILVHKTLARCFVQHECVDLCESRRRDEVRRGERARVAGRVAKRRPITDAARCVEHSA